MKTKHCSKCSGTGKKFHWLFGISKKTCPECNGRGYAYEPPGFSAAPRTLSNDEVADEIYEIRKKHQEDLAAIEQGLDPVVAPIINMQLYRGAMTSQSPRQLKKKDGESEMPVLAAENLNELSNFISEKLGDEWNDSNMELVTPDGKKWTVSRASVNIYHRDDPREDTLVVHLEPDPNCELQQAANERGKPEPFIQRIASDDKDNAAGFAAPVR